MNTSRSWIWIDYILATIRFIYYGCGIFYFLNNPDLIGSNNYFFYLWFALCIIIPHLFWRPRYINDVLFSITEFMLVGSFHLYFLFYLQEPIGISFLFMPALIIGFIGRRRTLIFGPITLLLLSCFNYYQEPDFYKIINYTLIVFMLFTFGYIFNHFLTTQSKMRLLLEENQSKTALIQSQNKVLEQYSKKVEELTLAAERNRIAGELHDTIGHTFTSVIVGMDAVMYLIDISPNDAKERLTILREVTKNGLTQVRQQIHNMAEDDQLSISNKLEKLAREFSEYTNTEVTIELLGTQYSVTRAIEMTLNRCLQEALTNAKRHGEATNIAINLTFHPESVMLEIKDNGKGFEELKIGFGLQTMKERLSQLGGDLIIQSEKNVGTTITCMIPSKGVYNEQNKTTIS
ncbi:sensor histidine kinase [Ureibacillus xyleni]|nr:sensor histidine kinase [Ureibacillus xyleni]